MHASYRKSARFYDSMHRRLDYDKESDFVLKRVKQVNPDARSLLDVGCGTGTHLQKLSRHFDILAGVDLNEEILDVAKSKFPSGIYQQSSMKSFKFDQRFDAIMSLYSVFNYNLTLEDAESTLKNMHMHLTSGGAFVLALYAAKNIERKVSIHAGKDESLESAKISDHVYDPAIKLETSSFVLFWKEDGKIDFITENNHQFRIFGFDEMIDLMERTGFSEPEFYDGYTDKSATDKSSYPILVSKKI